MVTMTFVAIMMTLRATTKTTTMMMTLMATKTTTTMMMTCKVPLTYQGEKTLR